MRFLPLVAITLVCWCGSPCLALAGQRPSSLPREFSRLQSEHFVAVGDASESQLRAALIELERFRAVLGERIPSLKSTSEAPNVLVLFRNVESMRPFMPRGADGRIRDVGGYFSKGVDANYMVTSADRRQRGFSTIFHEYMHYVLHHTLTVLPTWLDEGLAELYSTFRLRGDRQVLIGEVPEDRASWFRIERNLLPMERLVTPEGRARAFESDSDTLTFYGQAWAFVHYLTLGDRSGQLLPYIQALQGGRTEEAAFRTVFGVSFEQMRRELIRYLGRPALNALLLPLPDAALNPRIPPVERLTEADTRQFEGSLLLRLGEDAYVDAEFAINRTMELDPVSIEARVSLATLRWRQKRTAEVRVLLDALIADRPDDYRLQRLQAEILAAAGQHERALEAALRGTSLNAGVPDLWMLVSLEAAILGRAEQARDAFTRLRGIDSDPRWVYALAGRAYESGEWALVPQYAEVLAGGVGWPNQDAHYAGFKAVLALQRSSQRAAAESLLERIAAALPPRSWAAGVTSYLKGALDDEAFLARARSLGERTEAHAYIGLMAAIGGRREVALTHLRWVAERGDRTYAEYAMARQELQRLGDVQGLPR